MSGLQPIRGRVLKYEPADDVNTDVIWPGKYTYVQLPPEDMATKAMEGFDPEFPAQAASRSVLVVGKNFGCGSSREQASACLKYAGTRVVIARSFARIFYRNSLNLGLPVVDCPAAVDALEQDREVEVDLVAGELKILASSGQGTRTIPFAPYPEFVQELIAAGGLIAQIRQRRERELAERDDA